VASIDDRGLPGRFVVGSLATWRVTHLLAREDGPGDLVARTRAAMTPAVNRRWPGALLTAWCAWVTENHG
jgi:hypothetical protein